MMNENIKLKYRAVEFEPSKAEILPATIVLLNFGNVEGLFGFWINVML